ncbi:hypothetical protein SAMN05519103_02571 [Rhizobiales bacterium GAS113]|nr:hypothetical protein SAMN05519103_02571 [Rhizobiales bacterium GAS113]
MTTRRRARSWPPIALGVAALRQSGRRWRIWMEMPVAMSRSQQCLRLPVPPGSVMGYRAESPYARSGGAWAAESTLPEPIETNAAAGPPGRRSECPTNSPASRVPSGDPPLALGGNAAPEKRTKSSGNRYSCAPGLCCPTSMLARLLRRLRPAHAPPGLGGETGKEYDLRIPQDLIAEGVGFLVSISPPSKQAVVLGLENAVSNPGGNTLKRRGVRMGASCRGEWRARGVDCADASL